MQIMEHLKREHRYIAQKQMENLRNELPVLDKDVLETLMETNAIAVSDLIEMGKQYMKKNLAMAVVIWRRVEQISNSWHFRRLSQRQLFVARIALGPWEKAVELAQDSYIQMEKIHGETADPTLEQDDALFECKIDFGTACLLVKDIEKAENIYREALEIAMLMKDADKECLVEVCLGQCLLERGQLKQAIGEYFQPLLSCIAAMSTYTKALFLQSYGNASRSAADWKSAKRYLHEALKLACNLSDIDIVSSCCGDLGNVYRSEGRFLLAEKYHSMHYKLALCRGDIYGLATSCGNIGFLYYYNADERLKSVSNLAVSYSLADEVGDLTRKSIACTKLGKLYTLCGHFKQAVGLLEAAITIAQKASNEAREGMAWGDLGTVYRSLRNYEEAVRCHIIYRDNAKERLDIGGVAIMQHQLALDYLLKGDLQSAEASIVDSFKTLERVRSQLGEDEEVKISNFEKNQAEARNLLLVILVAQRKYKETFVLSDKMRARVLSEVVSKRYKDRRLAPTENLRGVPSVLDKKFIEDSFSNMLSLCRGCKSGMVSYSLVNEFTDGAGTTQCVYISFLSPSGKLCFERRVREVDAPIKVKVNNEFVISLRRSLSCQLGQESPLESLARFLPHRGQSHVPSLEQDEVILKLCRDLESSESQPQQLQFCAKQTRSEAKNCHDPSVSSTVVTINQKQLKNRILFLDRVSHKEQFDIKFVFPNTDTSSKNLTGAEVEKVEEAEEVIPPKKKKPNSYTDEDSLHVHVLTTDNKDTNEEKNGDQNKVLGTTKQLMSDGKTWSECWKPTLFALHKLLIDPIKQYLETDSENIERIIFVPQGFLLKIPFAALKADDEDAFLFEKFPIFTTPSVELLNFTTVDWRDSRLAVCNGEYTLLSVGNPKMPFKEVDQLPSAELEAKRVADVLECKEAIILTGTEATKESVVRAMSNSSLIHIASHAMVDEKDMHGDFSMRGFILLAKSNEMCDGILYAREIRDMELNAELVVLSCCDTALGKVTEEGVLGLSRAFLAAGAACVVVTLWKIEDSNTSHLMESFYKYYKITRDAPRSLQQAMKESQNDKSGPQIHNWAAFIIVGASAKIFEYRAR